MNNSKQKADNPSKSGKRMSVTIAKPAKFVPPEVTVKFTEVDVADVPHPGPSLASKAYWSIQISNLPRSTEYDVVKPYSNCLELHLLDLENVSHFSTSSLTVMFDCFLIISSSFFLCSSTSREGKSVASQRRWTMVQCIM